MLGDAFQISRQEAETSPPVPVKGEDDVKAALSSRLPSFKARKDRRERWGHPFGQHPCSTTPASEPAVDGHECCYFGGVAPSELILDGRRYVSSERLTAMLGISPGLAHQRSGSAARRTSNLTKFRNGERVERRSDNLVSPNGRATAGANNYEVLRHPRAAALLSGPGLCTMEIWRSAPYRSQSKKPGRVDRETASTGTTLSVPKIALA